MGLRQVIDAIKRVMTKEKHDRQITGQASSTPFMTVKVSQTSSRPYSPQGNRYVTFNEI